MSDKPPPKHNPNGYYGRADWFEARCQTLEAELADTQDALHVMLTAAKRDPDAPFDWPDRNERIGLVLAKAVERANQAVGDDI